MRGRALSQLNTRWCAGRSWRSTSSPGSSSAAAERSRSASRTTSSPAHSFGQSRARTGRFACRRARRGCGCTSCSCRGQTRDAGRQNSNFYITPLLSQHWQVSFGQGFSTSRTSGRQNSNFSFLFLLLLLPQHWQVTHADKLPSFLFLLLLGQGFFTSRTLLQGYQDDRTRTSTLHLFFLNNIEQIQYIHRADSIHGWWARELGDSIHRAEILNESARQMGFGHRACQCWERRGVM